MSTPNEATVSNLPDTPDDRLVVERGALNGIWYRDDQLRAYGLACFNAGRAEGGKDAERYRFLRDEANPDDEQPHCVINKTNDWGKSYDEWATGSALDETIDASLPTPPAAMTKEKP